MSEEKAPYNAGQQPPKPKQTDAEHEWNNEGGQLPTAEEPLAPSRQLESEDLSEQFTLTLNRPELIAIHKGLSLWLAKMKRRKFYSDERGEANQSETEDTKITQRLQERIDTLLGEQ